MIRCVAGWRKKSPLTGRNSRSGHGLTTQSRRHEPEALARELCRDRRFLASASGWCVREGSRAVDSTRTITEDCMATALAPDDVQQLWLAFKADPTNQDYRNRLVEQ